MGLFRIKVSIVELLLGSSSVRKNTVISPLCGNCSFPENFHTRKIGEITIFFAVVTLTQYKTFQNRTFSTKLLLEKRYFFRTAIFQRRYCLETANFSGNHYSTALRVATITPKHSVWLLLCGKSYFPIAATFSRYTFPEEVLYHSCDSFSQFYFLIQS